MAAKKNTKDQSENSLGVGFFFGILAGVIGTYLLTSPHGKKIKEELLQEFRRQKQTHTLEEIGISSSLSHQHEADSLAVGLKSLIERLKTIIGNKNFHLESPVKKNSTTNNSGASKKKHHFRVKS